VRPLLAFLAALLALVCAAPAFAHGTATFSVDVTEIALGKALVRARSSNPDAPVPRVTFEAPCSATAADDDGDALVVTCPDTLASRSLHVEGLGPLVSEAVVVVSLRDGRRLSRVLTSDDPSFTVPEAQDRAGIAAGYVRLGVAHILTGYDHLLFLLALVLLLRRWRAVLLAETAFTVSHSLSFSATALGLVHVSAPAAEAAIALSLVLVALDIGRTQEAASKGAMMAFVFGLGWPRLCERPLGGRPPRAARRLGAPRLRRRRRDRPGRVPGARPRLRAPARAPRPARALRTGARRPHRRRRLLLAPRANPRLPLLIRSFA
jgi:hypothetical protein